MTDKDIKHYYSSNRLSDGQKAALSENVKAASARPRIRHSSAVLQIAACLVLAVSTVALTSVIRRGDISGSENAASVSAPVLVEPSVTAESRSAGDSLSFTYYDPAFVKNGDQAFDCAFEPLFEYDGKTYCFSNIRSNMVILSFDNGSSYTLREVIDCEIIPVSELAAARYLVCCTKTVDSDGFTPHNGDIAKYFSADGTLRIENGLLVRNK